MNEGLPLLAKETHYSKTPCQTVETSRPLVGTVCYVLLINCMRFVASADVYKTASTEEAPLQDKAGRVI